MFNAKLQKYYIIVVKCLFIPYGYINSHIWIDQRYYKQYKAIAPSIVINMLVETKFPNCSLWRARQDKNTSFKIQDLFEKIVLINVRK